MRSIFNIEKYRSVKPVFEENYLYSLFVAFFLMASFLFYLSIHATVSVFENTVFFDKNIELIDRFADVGKNADISVIMLGDSRIRHATRYGIEAGDVVGLKDGRKLAVLQFSFNAAQFTQFDPLSGSIIKAKPDYLLIGRQVLSNRRAVHSQDAAMKSRLVLDYLLGFFKETDPEQIWLDERRETEECFGRAMTRKMMESRLDATRKRDNHSLVPEENENLEPLRQFLNSAQMAGIKVVILHIMPNTEILEKYDVPLHMLDAYGIGHMPTREELLPEQHNQVGWVTYHDDTGAGNYCDFVHLNEKGRVSFNKWFSNLFTENKI